MAGVLVVSETLDGAAISDALDGGGTGKDFGPVVNGQYGPIISKTANTGQQDLYISHDGTASITDFSAYIQEYGTDTGFAYGGAQTAASDFSTLISLATASGSSKNNSDGLSGGMWVEMDWDIATSSKFDQASRPAFVKIFGDAGTDGISVASKFLVVSSAMVYESGGENNGSAPVDGEIGAAGDTTLGDAAHLLFRFYIPTSGGFSGKAQLELVFSYAFTV